jgi:hypothetical protein
MSRDWFPAAWHRRLCPVLALALVAVCLAAEASDLARAPTMRVRIEWAADAPAVWAGRLTVAGGRFDQPESLGSARDDAGTISLDRGAVAIRRHSPRQKDAFEVNVTAASESRLEFELRDRHGNVPAHTIHLALADCLQKPRAFPSEGNRPRVVIRRAPGDALGVTFDRAHLVFDPEESFRMSIALNLMDPRDGLDKPVRAQFKWKLLPADGNRAVVEGSTTVAARVNPTSPVVVPLEVGLPHGEGVYNLRLAATGLGFPDVERIVQLVVVDPTPEDGPSRAGGAEPKLVDSFDPGSAGLFRKVSLNALRQKHEHPRARSTKARRSREEPESEPADRVETNGQAYKLRVVHPGQPHRLEVAVPPGSEEDFTITVCQTDGQGQLVPAGPDSMFSFRAAPSAARMQANDATSQAYSCSQLFWPNDREPIVVVTGHRSGKPPDVARVKVYELDERFFAGLRNSLPRDPGDGGNAELPQRLVGRYLHKPALAANFGAPQFFDAAERLALDDWQTFLQAGRRLTAQLSYQQHSALMLAVYAEGATIYPSQQSDSSLQFDNGRLSAGGQDPIQKDVLELVLRLFDRAGLALVPELQFNAPLPALERMLEEGRVAPEDLLLVDGEGRTRGEAPGPGGASPRYNVLSPHVQQIVLAMLRELLHRYRDHPALAGVAIELGPDSCVQLPGIEWGYDRQTIRRFEQAARIAVPRGEGREAQREVYRFLTTTARREWLRYRCSEVARFHRQLADAVLAACPRARIVFSGHLTPLGGSDSEAAIVEAVRAGGSPAHLLLGQGLDFSQPAYAADRRVTVLRPQIQNSTADGLVLAALATLNTSPAIDALYRTGRGGLLYSLSGAEDALRPETAASRAGGVSGLAAPAPSHSSADAQRYTHLFAALDARVIFDGGPTVPLTADEATLRLRRTISRLPDVPFQPVGPQLQPAVVRAAHGGAATWLYAANESPLPVVVELILDCPPTTACRSLENGKLVALEPVDGDRRCRLQFEPGPYGVWGCRIGRAAVDVLETRLSVPEELLADVQRRIDFLGVRMNTATSLARAGSKSLPNPGFETAGEGARELPGWELPVVKAGWTLDEDNPRSGHWSLQLSAEGKHPLLESPALALDGSRFVTMSSWMRSNRSAARVQMAFEAKIDGEPFRQEAVVEVGKSWKQYFFRVDQLPAGQMQNARLRVKPDSCKLWIDDVEIDAQAFSADEVRQLTKTLSSVKLAWDEGRYADCQRLLDGYWGQLLLSDPVAPPAVSPPRTRLSDRVKTMFRR